MVLMGYDTVGIMTSYAYARGKLCYLRAIWTALTNLRNIRLGLSYCFGRGQLLVGERGIGRSRALSLQGVRAGFIAWLWW